MGLPILFGAVVLLVSATLLLGANITALRDNLTSIDHSQRVLTELAKLEAALLSDEMTVRGYALTKDPRFIAFQNSEQTRCRVSLAALDALMSKESGRADDYRKISSDIRWHIGKFGSLLAPGKDATQTVSAAILDPVVRANMRSTRDGIRYLREAEIRDLSRRQTDLANQLIRAFFLAVGIIIAAFVLGAVGMWAALLKTPQQK